jgi:putative ABC transport system permease protein
MRRLPGDYAVRNLTRSATRLALSISGSTIVVLLLLAAGGFVRGMDLAMRSSGDANNVILLGAGSEESIERSEVEASVAGLVAASITGIRSRGGVDYVSPEVHVQLPVRIREGDAKGPLVLVRGITPTAMLVHPSVHIVDGRFPIPGKGEVMIGAMLGAKMGAVPANLALGKQLWIEKRPWTIVGQFSAPGTVMDAELWAALNELKEATKRTTDSCVILTLDPDRADASDVDLFTKTRVDLELSAMPETAYYAKLSTFFAPIRVLAWVTAALVALGGLLGGLNTMYAAFAARVRELGTLQACGYRRGAIVLSLVQESLLMTATGALLASVLGAGLMDGLAVRFSMGAFGLRVDAYVLGIGLSAGLVFGFVGALPPAWRCLRLDIPVALKAF